jgi:glycogen synthase
MQRLIQSAMAQDYSWEKSAAAYIALYNRALEVRG